MLKRLLDWLQLSPKDLIQIASIGLIVLLIMFTIAAIIDNPDNKQARNQFIMWACVVALLIGQAIF